MSLTSAFVPEFGGKISHMHQQQISNPIRAPIMHNSYNNSMSAATGVHVTVDGVPFQYQLTEDDLMKVFTRYGNVSHITVMDEGGAAIVQFGQSADAERATSALDGKVLNGVQGALRVTLFPPVPCPDHRADRFMNRKFSCRFEVSPEIDRDFHVSKRIIGQKGVNMKKIVSCLTFMDAAKLRLRGRGSGYMEGPYKQESSEPLHLCVSCRDGETYAIILREVTRLFENIYADYVVWCAERNIARPVLKVAPIDHPADAYVPGSTFGPPKSLYPSTWNEWKNQSEYAHSASVYSTHAGPSAVNTPPEVVSPSQGCPLDVGLIERMIEDRNEARRVCNFKEADRLRDLLKSYGIGLMDEPGARGKGAQVTTWKLGMLCVYRVAMEQTSFLPVKHAQTRRSDSTSTVDTVSQFSDPSFEFNAMKRQLFKTKVCRHFLSGKCKYNSSCTFAHSKVDLKLPPDFRKSRLCQKGNCNDSSCQYAHSSGEIRDTYSEMCPHWLKGSCPFGSSCKLSHNLTHLEELAIAASIKSESEPAPSVDEDALITPTYQIRDPCAIDLVQALLQMLSDSPNIASEVL